MIFKIQKPLYVDLDIEVPQYLLHNEDRSIMSMLDECEFLEEIMVDHCRIYVKGEVVDGVLVIDEVLTRKGKLF